MSVIKHPSEKKEMRLTKDHRIFVWQGNKTFRGKWKRKKKRTNRKERRDIVVVLKKIDPRAAEEADSPKVRTPRKFWKGGVVTLGRALDIRKNDPQKRFSLFCYSSHKFEA